MEMNNNDISMQTLYGEVCNAVRHYSNVVIKIRILAIIQTIFMIFGIFRMPLDPAMLSSPHMMTILAALGMMLILILAYMHQVYSKSIMNALNCAVRMEKDNSSSPRAGIWTSHHKLWIPKLSSGLARFLSGYGLFVVMEGVIFVAIVFLWMKYQMAVIAG